MTRNELLKTLRRIEHVQDSRLAAKFCPECGQNEFAKEGPHDYPCGLASAIAWLEDENNSERHCESDDGSVTTMWVLR